MPEHELTKVTWRDRLQVAKKMATHPGPWGRIWLMVMGALGLGTASLLAPVGNGWLLVLVGAVGIVPGVLVGLLGVIGVGYVRGSSEVLKERLRRSANAPGVGVQPHTGFQLKREFETELGEARDAVDEFSRQVQSAWRAFRRQTEREDQPPLKWHDALPDDPTEHEESLQEFAKGMASGSHFFYSGGNFSKYNQVRRRVEQFFNNINHWRLDAPDFYEATIEPRVKTQQFSILHMLSYLNTALAQKHFGQELESKPPWQQLWEAWRADPPEHKHRGI